MPGLSRSCQGLLFLTVLGLVKIGAETTAPFVSERFVWFGSSDCSPPFTFIQTEKLGECYYNGPVSWTNNCSANGSHILRLASGHRVSTTFNGQIHFKKIAGSKVLDEYYNTYLRK
jgi:hypothetical protein